MLALTGFQSVSEMTRELFEVIAWLEATTASYLETDQFFTQTSVQTSDRLVTYLTLIAKLKRTKETIPEVTKEVPKKQPDFKKQFEKASAELASL